MPDDISSPRSRSSNPPRSLLLDAPPGEAAAACFGYSSATESFWQ